MCVAIPGQVVAVTDLEGIPMATVRWGERELEVSLVLVPEAGAGDWILAHSGLAVRRLTQGEVDQTMELWAD